MLRHRWCPALVAAMALFALGPPSGAAVRIDPLQDEGGSYKVYLGDRLLGTERFSFEPWGDSVRVFSNVDQLLPTPSGDRHLDKKVSVVLGTIDYGLHQYTSEQNFQGRKLLRGLNVYDTTFTAYRETDQEGSGDTYLRPPGRVFVLDGQVFVLFDILLRSLHGKVIGERAVSVVILGEPRDSVMEIRFRPGATETIQLNGKPRTARKVSLSDGNTEFVTWVSTRGAMLRLEQPAIGLRVDRDPAAAPAPGAPKTSPATPAAKPKIPSKR